MRSDAWLDEAQWVPEDLDQALALVDALVDAGLCGRASAASLVEWLARKDRRDEDRTSAPARSKYRRLLRELEASGYHPPGSYSGVAQSAEQAAVNR